VATIPVPNGIKATMVYNLNTIRMVNVYWFTKGSPATLADLTSLANVLKTWENTAAKTYRTTGTSFVSVDCAAMDSAGLPVYTLPILPAIFGVVNTPSLPSYASIAIKHTTGLGGRSYRGRTYYIGVGQNMLNGADMITTTVQANISGTYTTLRSSANTAGFTMCVASLYHGVDGSGKPIPRLSGILTPILSSDCGIGLDTQRHRKNLSFI